MSTRTVAATAFCTSCGTGLLAGYRFCVKCGASVTGSGNLSIPNSPPVIPNQPATPVVNYPGHQTRTSMMFLCLAIFFSGILLTIWVISEALGSSYNEFIFRLTKISLNGAIGIAALSLFFARRRITLKKTFIATALMILGIVLFVLFIAIQSGVDRQKREAAQPAKMQPAVAEPPSQTVASTWAPATLLQQKICSEQAEKSFNDSYSADKNMGPTYTTHYDPTASVCYMEVTTRQMVLGNNFQYCNLIYDAFENRVYGDFMSFSKNVKPTKCSIKPRGQLEILCNSNEEFDSLARKYFGTVPD